ncbi:hypothetical protein Trydic_g11137 [Trypoxylus dichotomus]
MLVTLVNLTDKTLPSDAIQILEEGGNFTVTPKSVLETEIITNVEDAISRLPWKDRYTIRTDVACILRTSKPPKGNISLAEWKALQQLKQDESLIITLADKDNATVITSMDEYNPRIKLLHEPPTYVTNNLQYGTYH